MPVDNFQLPAELMPKILPGGMARPGPSWEGVSNPVRRSRLRLFRLLPMAEMFMSEGFSRLRVAILWEASPNGMVFLGKR